MISDNTEQRVLSESLRKQLKTSDPQKRSRIRGIRVADEIGSLIANDRQTDDIRDIVCELAAAGNWNGVDSIYLFDGQFRKVNTSPYSDEFTAEYALIERIFDAAQSPSRLNLNLTRRELEDRIVPLFKVSAVSTLREDVWQFEDNLLVNRVRRGVTRCQEVHHPDYPDPTRNFTEKAEPLSIDD